MTVEQTRAIKIFYCYAHADKALRAELETHLAPLKRLEWIITWHDREVNVVMEWEHEIDPHLNTADIILILVSPNFMVSDYCWGIEMKRALERHERGEARVIPIILRPAFWEGAPFGKLQALPTNAKSVTSWRSRDKALEDVVRGIRDAVRALLSRKIEELSEVYHRENAILSHELAHFSLDNKKTANLILQEKIASGSFDVFLCHNNKDKFEVKKIGELLKERGIYPWLDEWELRPGFPWQRLLEEQIEQIKSAAVFVGEDGIGPWQRQEMDAFLREFANRGCPVIPVLLKYAPSEPKLPLFLRGITWVDFRKQEPNPLRQLIWGITGERDRF